VTFRRGDLIRDRFPDAEAGLNDFDLILCRNVFIYLDAQAVAQITAKFAEVLTEGAYLVTGHSELFGHDTAPLRVRMFAQSAVFQKTAQGAAEAGLGVALAQMQVPAVAALVPSPGIARKAPRVGHRAVPSAPPAAPMEDCDRLLQAAWRHANRGMREEAEQDCRKAIALAAFDARPYFLLAQLAQERGDAIEAKSLLKKAIYLDHSFIAAYLELGALHAQAGEDDRARRMYETARMSLSKLPAQAAIPPYGESTAADILAYIERLLGSPAEEAAGAAMVQAQLHRNS
jgi:chemotaxis protein methyltransferase CheR